MRVDDLVIRNLTHIPLDRPFGNELEDRMPKVFGRAGMSYVSTVGSDDDTKWGYRLRLQVRWRPGAPRCYRVVR